MNDRVSISPGSDLADVSVTVKMTPEAFAAAFDALNVAGDLLRGLFRKRTGADFASADEAIVRAPKGARR